MDKEQRIREIVMSALLTALTILSTVFLKIPMFSGYVHIGFAIVCLTIVVMGVKYGVIIAAISTALADVFSGFAIWAPGSFLVILVSMGIYGFCLSKTVKKYGELPLAPKPLELCGVILAGIIFVFGYYIYGALVLYGWAGALVEVIPNAAQFLIGIIVGKAVGVTICRTNMRKYFQYPYERTFKKEKIKGDKTEGEKTEGDKTKEDKNEGEQKDGQ